MSKQGSPNTGAAGQVSGGAAGMGGVTEQRAQLGNRASVGGARVALRLSVVVALVCLLAVPSFASAEAITDPLPANAPAAPGDEYWSAGFYGRGIHPVSALEFGLDGALYAGGSFIMAGKVVANCIARWDGTQWHPLGSGMGGVDYPYVHALAFGPDGSLYVGGRFITAGGATANNIARWDGSQWHPLGSGMNHYGYVHALAVGPDGSLYAGGDFTTAGGATANYIARWDGSQWHPLGSGMGGVEYPSVRALAVGPDGSLYAGGEFTTAGGVAANYIARWDGSQWHPLSSGMDRATFALTFGPDGSLYAGGRFDTAGGVAANRIARWDGLQWHPLGGGMGGGIMGTGSVYSLAFGSNHSLYAGGSFTTAGGAAANYIAHWDGAQWDPMGGGMEWHVYALIYDGSNSLYAGGYFSRAGGVIVEGIALWDGAQWHHVSAGEGVVGGDVRALVFGSDGSLYAAGSFTGAGAIEVNQIARFDGTRWHPLGSGMNYSVDALAIDPNGSLYAGGPFTAAGGVAASHIARWDGSLWHPLGDGTVYDPVYALAVGPDGALYAGASVTDFGVMAYGIARWDGSQWHALGSGVSGRVHALAVGPDGSLYAGGDFSTAGGVTVGGIARWDGAQWHPLGSGMDGWPPVLALAVGPDGSLYAGGTFTTAGGVAANYIARWDGSQWHALGSGMGGMDYPSVRALAVGPDGSLYAGGRFTTAGGVAASHIARWDGAQWHPLGSGIEGFNSPGVDDLALDLDGTLYAGGTFSSAGGKPSLRIAQWNGEAVRRCDFNESGAVDVGDIMIVAALWNQAAGPPYDLDGDGVITVVDIQRVARWWGWAVPSS